MPNPNLPTEVETIRESLEPITPQRAVEGNGPRGEEGREREFVVRPYRTPDDCMDGYDDGCMLEPSCD